MLIPPRAVLVARGKDGRPRVLPLNSVTQEVFSILVADCVTGDWLFTNREGEPMKAVRKGFTAACQRAGIVYLRPYDLRHTFATRLLERGVHHYVISALLGHSSPLAGAGFGSHMTPGYAHVSWETMVKEVEVLKQPVSPDQNIFSLYSGKIPADSLEAQKDG